MQPRKCLVVTDVTLWKESAGNEARIAHALRRLAERSSAALFVNRALSANEAAALRQRFPQVELGCSQQLTAAQGLCRAMRRWANQAIGPKWSLAWYEARGTFHWHAVDPAPLAAWLKRTGFRPDVAIFHYARFHPCAAAVDCPTLVDTHDVASARSIGAPADRISPEREASCLAKFDAAIAISEADQARLRQLNPGQPTLLLPHAPRAVACEDPASWTLGFIGGDTEPNRDALRALLAIDQPYPIVVAGAICRRLRRRDRARPIGPVGDIREFYSRISCLVNLTEVPSGQKIKNVEALAYGKRVVTTREGAEGIPLLATALVTDLANAAARIREAANASPGSAREQYAAWAARFDYASALEASR